MGAHQPTQDGEARRTGSPGGDYRDGNGIIPVVVGTKERAEVGQAVQDVLEIGHAVQEIVPPPSAAFHEIAPRCS